MNLCVLLWGERCCEVHCAAVDAKKNVSFLKHLMRVREKPKKFQVEHYYMSKVKLWFPSDFVVSAAMCSPGSLLITTVEAEEFVLLIQKVNILLWKNNIFSFVFNQYQLLCYQRMLLRKIALQEVPLARLGCLLTWISITVMLFFFLDSILLHYFMCNNSSMSVIPGLCKNSGEY